MKLSLRGRFALICALLVAISMLAASLVWFLGVRAITAGARDISAESIQSHAEADLAKRARTIAAMTAENLANPVYFYDLYEMQAMLGPLRSESDVFYTIVFDMDGRVIHDGHPDIPTFGQLMDDALAGLARAAVEDDRVAVHRGEGLLEVTRPIRLSEVVMGGFRLGFSTDALRQELAAAESALNTAFDGEVQRRIDVLVLIILPLLGVGIAMAVVVSRNLVSPIKHLVHYTSQIEAGQYEFDADTKRSDEIGDLMRAFDRMSESVRRNTLEIRHIAYHDSLSGLPNRLMFREFLEQRLAQDSGREQRIALMFLDLDDFKRVNDTLGHDHGDQLLVAFAERLRQCAMDPSIQTGGGAEAPTRLVARLGGDEFTVMLLGRECRDAARELAHLVLDAVKSPFRFQEREFYVSTSIGITVYPEDAHSADVMVKNADIAMYSAKVAGKNRYQFFHEKMLADADQRMEMEAQLRRAARLGEFEVRYQPIVRLSDRRVVGAEALVRWQHPDRGELPPGLFIPLSEELGLIDVIGHQVLRTACHDLAGWPVLDGGTLPYVSVNLSGRQLRTDRVVGLVEQAVEQNGVEPGQLALEFTENSLLENEAWVSEIIQDLRGMGVRVWLDDFGTGFSGLSHLRRIPVDGVKIDRSFVSDILLDPDDLALTSAIVAMALSLNMQVVAEGVENDGQVEVLQQQGCRHAQGYLFGKPMTNEAFLELLGHAPRASSRRA